MYTYIYLFNIRDLYMDISIVHVIWFLLARARTFEQPVVIDPSTKLWKTKYLEVL